MSHRTVDDAAPLPVRPFTPPSRRRRIFVRRHPVVTAAVLLAAIALLLGAWLAYDLNSIRRDLEAADARASSVRDSVLQGDTEAVSAAVTASREHADDAAATAGGVPMTVARRIPFLGRSVNVVSGIAHSAADASACLDRSGRQLSALARPDELRRPDGSFDIVRLRTAAADITTVAQCLGRVAVTAHTIPRSSIPILDQARRQAVTAVTKSSELLRTATLLARVAPTMLGADRDQTYLVGLQTNAEARGTGGLIGGFLVVRARGGRITVTDRVDDLELRRARPMDLGADYQALYGYGEPTQLWQNSNLSPHFPYAAQIWRNLWRQRSGQTVDGVISVDPVALSYLLSASGPVAAEGLQVDGKTFTALAEEGVYSRFEGDRAGRKGFLGAVGSAIFSRALERGDSTVGLLRALSRGIDERRIALWSADTAQQELISSTRIGHSVPYSPAPYAAVVVNNSAGSKLDYYLDRDVTRTVMKCDARSRLVSVDVMLTSAVPSTPLPAEVLGPPKPVSGSPPAEQALEAKDNRITLSLYASWGARFTSVTVDGAPVGFGMGRELGHPVAYAVVVLKPNTPVTVSYSVTEPPSPGDLEMPTQPLARDAVVTSSSPRCAGD